MYSDPLIQFLSFIEHAVHDIVVCVKYAHFIEAPIALFVARMGDGAVLCAGDVDSGR